MWVFENNEKQTLKNINPFLMELGDWMFILDFWVCGSIDVYDTPLPIWHIFSGGVWSWKHVLEFMPRRNTMFQTLEVFLWLWV